MRSRSVQQLPSRSNSGFTLIELIVVVAIIATLIGLLLPAIRGAFGTARVTQVRTEISTIEAALAQFQNHFGVMPPGALIIHQTKVGWDMDNSPLGISSKAILRQMFPQFDFTYKHPYNTSLDGILDVYPVSDSMSSDFGIANGLFGTLSSNVSDETITLVGAEVLVFCLGGVADLETMTTANVNGFNLAGFSKNPTNPFVVTGKNRIGPYFEFVASRFVSKDGDRVPEYLDPIPRQQYPYLYFSSNDGIQYRTGGSGTDWCNADNWTTPATPAKNADPVAGNWMKYAYYPAAAAAATLPNQTATPLNAKKYQIISPGVGGVKAGSAYEAYGTGGLFNEKDTTSLGEYDGDNITNFHGGTLGGK